MRKFAFVRVFSLLLSRDLKLMFSSAEIGLSCSAPAWFIPTISPSYQTDSNGMISISGTISVGNHPTTTFDRSMAYNWTCTAPNLQSASGTQEFSTASWAATGSELSHTVSYDAFSGVLLQTIQLSP